MVHGYDRGWTTNLPLDDFLSEDALVAILHDGAPISTEHGGPARLIVPRLYAWKSAKWVAGVELMAQDRAGLLGSQWLSHARRPMVGRTVQRVAPLLVYDRGALLHPMSRDVGRSCRGRLYGILGVDLVQHAGDVQALLDRSRRPPRRRERLGAAPRMPGTRPKC